MRLILPLTLFISIVCATWYARAQGASSFQQSCNNIQVSGSTLSASCRRVDGSFNNTSILIRGIANNNGVLQLTGTGASSFQDSCNNISVAGSTLSASCRRMDGSFNQTSILIPGIANNNGVLTHQ
jgi:CVNH domain